MQRLLLVLVVAGSTPAAFAQPQHACFTNLVPNGDFQAPAWQDPWVYRGQGVAVPRSFKTNGVDTNQAMEFASTQNPGQFVIEQPTSFVLAAGVDYELSIDWWVNTSAGFWSGDVGLTMNSTRTRLVQGGLDGLRRWSTRFRVSTAGAYTLDLTLNRACCSGGTGPHYVDNVSIRAFHGVTFNLPDRRGSGRQASQAFVVSGPPSRNFVIFLGVAGFSPPIPVPTCSGEWLLGLPPVPFSFPILGTDGSGQHQGAVTVPASVSGAALYWQVVLLHPACGFGCPVMIGFE